MYSRKGSGLQDGGFGGVSGVVVQLVGGGFVYRDKRNPILVRYETRGNEFGCVLRENNFRGCGGIPR
jgi:hypothetical protein